MIVNMPKTFISVVLDESGSMQNIRSDTIGGFNSFLEDQKNSDTEALVSLTKFNTGTTEVCVATPLEEVEELSNKTYTPNGGTALFDAVAKAISSLETAMAREDKKSTAALVVVISDGEENSSQEICSKDEISKMIKDKEGEGNWSFVFIGADLDKWVGHGYGFAASNTRRTSKIGTIDTYTALSDATHAYRCKIKGLVDAGVEDLNEQDFFASNADAWDKLDKKEDDKKS